MSFLRSFLYSRKYEIILLVIILFGAFLRFYKLGEIPVGLNQDEASMTIEAKALLETGKDRWGNPFPVYFPSWGSGQNVLLSYLTVPFIYLFGVSIWSTRVVSALLGVLAILLAYNFTLQFNKEKVSKNIALISAFLMAVLPWPLVATRWGLESNILPFFLLLGFYTVSLHLQKNTENTFFNQQSWQQKLLYSFSLVPFALALYAYGTSVTVIPIIFILTVLFYRKVILGQWKSWLVSLGLFVFTSLPIGLFLLKNYITKVNYSWEQFLPFTAPLLKTNRLDEIGRDAVLNQNYTFILDGFTDNLAHNTVPGFGTIPSFLLIFSVIGVVYILYVLYKNRSIALASRIHEGYPLLLIWLISCVGNLLVIPANVNRANVIFIPLILLSVVGIQAIYNLLPRFKIVFLSGIVCLLVSYSSIFLPVYFYVYPLQFHFARNLETPFNLIKQNTEPTLITNKLSIHYAYFLFYTNFPITQFQAENKNTNYSITRMGNFYSESSDLFANKVTHFPFMLSNSQNDCSSDDTKTAVETITYQDTDWKVGYCDVVYK